jgi:hypothetical protein
MGAIYKNRKADAIKNTRPGYSVKAWLLPVDWVTTFADVVGNAAQGDRKTITDSHITAVGKGAIACYAQPKSIEAPGKLVGANGGKSYLWSPKIVLEGDDAATLDMLDGLVNKKFLLFVEDAANCANGVTEFVQFGCDCDPATVADGDFTSGTVGSDSSKVYSLTFESFCKFFYSGTITELAAPVVE